MKRATYLKLIQATAAGLAIGSFARGLYRYDATALAIAFIFLAVAWMYREMYLGWDDTKRSWKFVSRASKEEE